MKRERALRAAACHTKRAGVTDEEAGERVAGGNVKVEREWKLKDEEETEEHVGGDGGQGMKTQRVWEPITASKKTKVKTKTNKK